MGTGPSAPRTELPLQDVPAFEDGYPPPRPPSWKKRDVFDAHSSRMADVESKAKEVQVDSDTTYEQLASALTGHLTTDLEKVRSIFVWMGNIDYEGQHYPTRADNTTPMGFIQAVKYGHGRNYLHLFFALVCRVSGIPCVVLGGHCKGANYEVGDQPDIVDKYVTNWNAIYIDGSWQIIHPHWAYSCLSGFTTGKWTKLESKGKGCIERFEDNPGNLVREIDEDYFLPDPNVFLYTCMANKKEWQLVDEPWDLEKFCNVPQFKTGYFHSDYTLRGPKTAVVVSRDGKCEIRFRECNNPRSRLTYELFFDEKKSEGKLPNQKDLPRHVFFETNGKDLRLLVRFHVIGIYKLVIRVGGKTLVTFRLEAKEKSSNPNILPAVPEIGYGFCRTSTKNGLSEPSHTAGIVVTEPKGVEIFTFRNIINANISCKLSHCKTDSIALQRYIEQTEKDNVITITVKMPSGDEYALQIYQNQCINILNYLLTSQKKDFDTGEERSLERNLALGCATGNMAQLHRAILDFENAGFEDTEGLLLKANHNMNIKREEEKRKEEVARLSTELLTAIKKTNGEEGLQEAISRAEGEGFPELEDLLRVARRRARVTSE